MSSSCRIKKNFDGFEEHLPPSILSLGSLVIEKIGKVFGCIGQCFQTFARNLDATGPLWGIHFLLVDGCRILVAVEIRQLVHWFSEYIHLLGKPFTPTSFQRLERTFERFGILTKQAPDSVAV